MPYKRKSNYKKRAYTKKRKAYTKPAMNMKTLTKFVKKITLKESEPKQKYTAIAKTNVLHNAFLYRVHLNQTANMPIQGVKDSERVGDQINMTGFKIKMLCGQQADRPNINWLFYVLQVPKGGAASYSYAAWFENITGNVMIDSPNKDYVKVLHRSVMHPNEAGLAATGGKEYTFFRNLWVPRKKIVKFGPADSAVTHNDDDIVLLVASYDAYGTLPMDIVSYVEALVTVYYRDP
nr:MAG: putative capsid protein [Arizlama virus]